MTTVQNTPRTEWPKRPDGSNKSMGEMTREEQKAVLRPILADLKRELESPEFRATLARVRS